MSALFVVTKDGKFLRGAKGWGRSRTTWGKLVGALIFTKAQAANMARDFGGSIARVRDPEAKHPEIVPTAEPDRPVAWCPTCVPQNGAHASTCERATEPGKARIVMTEPADPKEFERWLRVASLDELNAASHRHDDIRATWRGIAIGLEIGRRMLKTSERRGEER